MIPRLLKTEIINALHEQKKAIIMLGARQVGKTVLVKDVQREIERKGKKTFYLNCDIAEDLTLLNTTSLARLQKLTEGLDFLIIDEAQRLDDPGLTIKIIHDHLPHVRLLITGSSSFELKNSLSDALTGRYVDFTLHPLSLPEVLQNLDAPPAPRAAAHARAESMLDDALRFGLYPEIHSAKKPADKRLLLEKIIESYLFKDILSFSRIRRARIVADLTRALAYQIGSLVSENELANRLHIDRKTVASYLDILEQAFVIIRVYPFSKNARREIGKNYKIYFTDLGIRNGLIGDFNPVHLRPDLGALWENFLIIERMKSYANRRTTAQTYFWRRYNGQKVDYVERAPATGKLTAYEFKYSDEKPAKGSRLFEDEYHIPVTVIHRNNFFEFIT